MKKLFLILTFLTVVFTLSAQEVQHVKTEQSVKDSLAYCYSIIDTLNLYELEKQQEIYIYKCRVEPNEIDISILAYIEKRIILLK